MVVGDDCADRCRSGALGMPTPLPPTGQLLCNTTVGCELVGCLGRTVEYGTVGPKGIMAFSPCRTRPLGRQGKFAPSDTYSPSSVTAAPLAPDVVTVAPLAATGVPKPPAVGGPKTPMFSTAAPLLEVCGQQ